MRTDKDMALNLLADPPRAVLDGFGRKRGELWEKFQHDVVKAEESCRVGGVTLRPRLLDILCDRRVLDYDLGNETEEEQRAHFIESVKRAETEGEFPLTVSHDGYVGAGCVQTFTNWYNYDATPTAFMVPPEVAPYFLIHRIEVCRTVSFFDPVPAVEFVERRRLILPRISAGERILVTAENIDGACHRFFGTFWCVHDDPMGLNVDPADLVELARSFTPEQMTLAKPIFDTIVSKMTQSGRDELLRLTKHRLGGPL